MSEDVPRVLVTGSRSLHGRARQVLEVFCSTVDGWGLAPFVLIHGGAKGVDTYVAEHCLQVPDWCVQVWKMRPTDADRTAAWQRWGTARKAPLIRNERMVDVASHVIGIWDGRSGGTSYTLNYARDQGLPLVTVML